jgi:hypothetical protein
MMLDLLESRLKDVDDMDMKVQFQTFEKLMLISDDI